MACSLEKGAQIVMNDWCRIKPGEHVLIISDQHHFAESTALWAAAEQLMANVVLLTIPESTTLPVSLFNSMLDFLAHSDVIVGATNYSLITTRAVREVLKRGSRFLSLPLATNDGRSALTYNFMEMNPYVAKSIADPMLAVLHKADTIRVTTALGTDLHFGKKGREAGIFYGIADQPGMVGSSSFEIYIGIEETLTNGIAIVDGSLGYIGLPKEPLTVRFEDGKLVEVEDTAAGNDFRQYVEHFDDPGMYVAGEFGIGLNEFSHCNGNCYIEDESTYGTFHIGMGRNLALGGIHDAAGHFDLVFHKPDIYADDTLIMKNGQVVVK